jgi:hypothetical protein
MRPWRLFSVALALPVLFTGIVLGDVQRNRSRGREAMELSAREFSLDAGSDANSGMTAWLSWVENDRSVRWLTPAKLAALGFDPTALLSPLPGRQVRPQLQRRAFIVMELRERQPTRSRLVPIDAGLNRDELVARYPDGRTHLITAGVVALQGGGGQGTPWVDGYLVGIDPRRIHVPAALAGRLRQRLQRAPAFTMSVRYGSQLEPWIVAVR